MLLPISSEYQNYINLYMFWAVFQEISCNKICKYFEQHAHANREKLTLDSRSRLKVKIFHLAAFRIECCLLFFHHQYELLIYCASQNWLRKRHVGDL